MIELHDVTKIYPGAVTAVDSLSLTVQQGEIFGLIGTSGCGKTTTLKMINRLEEATSGKISINGQSILDGPPEELRRGIGYVIQDVGLFPHYTVIQNITITPKLLGWQKDRVKQRSSQLLKLVGLEPEQFAHRMPDALSGGQQQRVGLARALAADPPVILMDEPFGALDPITKERIQGEFKKLLQEIQKTIVLVTHDVFEAFDLCDRIGLMKAGRLQQIGAPRKLLFQPSNDFVRSFFDSRRFQLELKSITVKDILDVVRPNEAPESLNSGGMDVLNISENSSFFSVFKDSHFGETFVVLDEREQPVAQITHNELLKGFQQVHRNLKEKRDG